MISALKKQVKHMLFKWQGLRASFGSSVACPVCNHSYSHLRTFNGRPNAMCFHCRSLERDRSLFLYLTIKTSLFTKPTKLLHFAPEISLYPVLKKISTIDYTTADLMVTLNSFLQVIPDYEMSVTDIKFDDGTFDAIICNHVLDDVDDDHKALDEFYRVLKPGGMALLSVPLNTLGQTIDFDETEAKKRLRIQMNISAENQRSYGMDFKGRVEGHGFSVTTVTAIDLVTEWRNNAVRKEDVIFVCLKK
jgi:SAM-dependent methyltransferase